jgi:hypothetical protein
MKRSLPKSVLFIIVPLLVWSSYSWAQDITDPQSGSHEVSQATVEPRFDWVAPEQYILAEPPQLSLEQLRRLEEALEKTHRSGPPLPAGPTVHPEFIGPTSPPTQAPPLLEESEELDAPPKAPEDFEFERNQDLGFGAPAGFTSNIGEPSAATKGNVVFQSGNWYGALSTNGGNNFSFVNPFTGPFPPVDGGFCCDQIVIYEPSRDALFYLQQYIADAGGNTHRINVDQGGDGTFDCSYDFTPQNLDRPDGDWFDFPELTLGTNSLYHTSNIFDQTNPFAQAAMISRYPLDQIASCQGFDFSFFVATNRFSFRATHGAGNTVYWGAHSTTRSMRIYRWAESSGTIFWDNRGISAWSSATGTCPGPDGRDWCGRADGRILGAYVANGVIGFMWNAAQGGGFAFPHVQIARFRESDRTLIDQVQIWNPELAWQYPSVGVNTSGDIAGTILWGGGNFFPNCAAWIADDVNSGTLAPLETYAVVNSNSGPTGNRSGDYLASRPHWPDFTNSWIGTCFSLQGGGANRNARPRYAWFGRERDLPAPICGVLGFASSTPSTLGALPTAIWLVLPVLFVAVWRLSLKRKKETGSGRT